MQYCTVRYSFSQNEKARLGPSVPGPSPKIGRYHYRWDTCLFLLSLIFFLPQLGKAVYRWLYHARFGSQEGAEQG